ncbi:LuxR C-terminal-related transcriptional regulator [Streptomonospora sp. PA3]|uniref:response regulator transcription factor n=1 Tax=Streptomonospora sp. PA3 TaxID=2607326 RepID=UPI0031BA4B7A
MDPQSSSGRKCDRDASATTCACELIDSASTGIQALERLTERETRVLGLLATGVSNRCISRALGVSERTIKAHVTRILDKLEVQSRLQAALAYIFSRWQTCPDLALAARDPIDADARRPD